MCAFAGWSRRLGFGIRGAAVAISLLATLPQQVCGFEAPEDDQAAADAKPDGKPAATDEAPAPPKVKLGLHTNEPGALQGYTLLSPLGATKTYLLDMEGRVVRTWDCGCTPMSSFILENGNLLRFGKLAPDEQKFGFGPGEAGRIQEFTFDGDVVWDYKFGSENQLPHHDIRKLPNGNVLMIVWEKKHRDEAIAAGRAPENVGDQALQPDCLMEIKPTGKTTGDIVWEWHLWDHLIQDRDSSKANYGNVAEHPELVDVNFGEGLAQALKNQDTVNQLAGIGYVGGPGDGRPGKVNADWTHCNGIDYNAELDQIVISVHAFSEIWIIDHSTTTEEAKGHTGGRSGKGGDLLYRWGNPASYRAGDKASQTLFSQHNAQWIPPGYPGAGHLLLFNNRHEDGDGKYSSVDEIELPVDEKGNYQRPTGEAFGPKAAIWSYTAPKKTDFYSNFISGTQRLANGNTLICSGANGTLYEVTPDKQLVWKYINPTKESPFGPGGPGGGPGGPGGNGFFGPPQIGKLLPTFALDRLKLTDEQRKQVEDIEKEAQDKLDKVLNEEQRKQFADLKQNPFPGGGPGFGPPGGGGPNFGPPGDGGGPNFGPPGRGGPQVAGGPNFGPPGDGGGRGRGGRGRGPGGGGPGGGGPAGGPPGGPGSDGPPGGTAVFRAYRYAADYVGFQGKDMKPGKTLVEIVDEAEKEKKNKAKEKEAEKAENKEPEKSDSK